MRVAACNGQMPFDTAFNTDDGIILAWLVANGENNGGSYDWTTGQWADRR